MEEPACTHGHPDFSQQPHEAKIIADLHKVGRVRFEDAGNFHEAVRVGGLIKEVLPRANPRPVTSRSRSITRKM